MKQQTLGAMVSSLRKEHNMTQLDLATKMNVTDKAVSKWERDISCPDINSLPKLAGILEVSVDDLMQWKSGGSNNRQKEITDTITLIFKVIPVAMGVAVTVLSILNKIDARSAFIFIGIGVACAGIGLISGDKDEDK